MRYISRLRETNAERVVAWRSTMDPESADLAHGSESIPNVPSRTTPHPLTLNIFSSLNPFASVPPTPTHTSDFTNISSLSPSTPNTSRFSAYPTPPSNRSSFLPFTKRQSLGGHAPKDHEDPDGSHRRRGSMPVKKTQSKRPSFIAFSKQRTSLPAGAPPLPPLPPWPISLQDQAATREAASVDPLDSAPPEPRNQYLCVQMEMTSPTFQENETQHERRASESKLKRVWKILTCRPAK